MEEEAEEEESPMWWVEGKQLELVIVLIHFNCKQDKCQIKSLKMSLFSCLMSCGELLKSQSVTMCSHDKHTHTHIVREISVNEMRWAYDDDVQMTMANKWSFFFASPKLRCDLCESEKKVHFQRICHNVRHHLHIAFFAQHHECIWWAENLNDKIDNLQVFTLQLECKWNLIFCFNRFHYDCNNYRVPWILMQILTREN